MINIVENIKLRYNKNDLKEEILKIVKFLEKKYKKKYTEINVCFMSVKEITSLNKKFLGKNIETDILSFLDCESEKIAGDIAISLDTVINDAKRDKKKYPEYLAEIVLHGCLHLFGMEHDYSEESLTAVYKLQSNFLKNIHLNRDAFNVTKD